MKKKLLSLISFVLGCGVCLILFSMDSQRLTLPTAPPPDPFASYSDEFNRLLNGERLLETPLFTPQGEYLYAEKNTDWSYQSQTHLSKGTLFWSTALLFDQPQTPTLPFSFETYTAQNGTLLVGDILIVNPGSNILLERTNNSTRIQNKGHAVDIYFEGAQRPFVLPSKRQIKIYDAHIHSKTPQIFYSKLKKDFQMQKPTQFDDRLEKGIQTIENHTQNVYAFATVSQKGRLYFEEPAIMTPIKNLQATITPGLSQKRRDTRKFSQAVRPFFLALEGLFARDFLAVEKHLDQFIEHYQDDQFHTILARNPHLQRQWMSFLQSHRAWLQTVLIDDPAYRFVQFWEQNNVPLSPNQAIERYLFSAEKFLNDQQYERTRHELENLKKILAKGDFESQQAIERVTKTRRILMEMIKNNDELQTRDVFALHRALVEKEIAHHTDPDLVNEIKFENSRDILWCIQYFLHKRKSSGPFQEIINTYRSLNISHVEKELGVQVFSEKEKELIELIIIMGNNTITPEGLERLRDVRQKKAEEKEAFSELESLKKHNQENTIYIVDDPNHILNKDALKKYFERHGASVSRFEESSHYDKTSGLYSTFSGIYQKGKSIRGSFYYDIQLFKDLSFGQEKINRITPEMLIKLWDTDPKTSSKTPPDVSATPTHAIVPQQTQNAIQARLLVQELFRVHGLNARRNNITILDQDQTKYTVEFIPVADNVTASVTFNKETSILFDITLHKGSRPYSVDIAYLTLKNAAKTLKREAEKYAQ